MLLTTCVLCALHYDCTLIGLLRRYRVYSGPVDLQLASPGRLYNSSRQFLDTIE